MCSSETTLYGQVQDTSGRKTINNKPVANTYLLKCKYIVGEIYVKLSSFPYKFCSIDIA